MHLKRRHIEPAKSTTSQAQCPLAGAEGQVSRFIDGNDVEDERGLIRSHVPAQVLVVLASLDGRPTRRDAIATDEVAGSNHGLVFPTVMWKQSSPLGGRENSELAGRPSDSRSAVRSRHQQRNHQYVSPSITAGS